MITPKFEVQQDESSLICMIHAPYSQLSSVEICIAGDTFTFYASPYYLRLTFQGQLVDSELEKHSIDYNSDHGTFTVKCLKETAGEVFPNLNLLTTLLSPHIGSDKIKKPLIEVVAGTSSDVLGNDDSDDDSFDWFYEQKLPDDTLLVGGQKYGFGLAHSCVFQKLQEELHGIVDISDPDHKTNYERRMERFADEKLHFNDDHYLADLFDGEEHLELLEFVPAFYDPGTAELTDLERDELIRLPRKEFLLDRAEEAHAYCGLVDLVFAWCYNNRITMGDTCAESAWNISKLSATLSWFESFGQLRDVISSCVRRSLVFPLVRNWDFAMKVVADTVQILTRGRSQVLRCLLQIQRIFSACDPYYFLNQLYITDYCVWIQTTKEIKLQCLASSVGKIKLNKNEMYLDLEELEAAARSLIIEDGDNKEAKKKENNQIDEIKEVSQILESNVESGIAESNELCLGLKLLDLDGQQPPELDSDDSDTWTGDGSSGNSDDSTDSDDNESVNDYEKQ